MPQTSAPAPVTVNVDEAGSYDADPAAPTAPRSVCNHGSGSGSAGGASVGTAIVIGDPAGASTQAIGWTHNLGAAATFRVEVSANGGTTWNLVNAAAPSTGPDSGSASWLVRKPNSPNARVRVR